MIRCLRNEEKMAILEDRKRKEVFDTVFDNSNIHHKQKYNHTNILMDDDSVLSLLSSAAVESESLLSLSSCTILVW